MKVRNLLSIVAMLSILLFGVGTANAVLGVNDAVPGTDIVIPFICAVDPLSDFNTTWAIADTLGGPPLTGAQAMPCPAGTAVGAHYTVFNRLSEQQDTGQVCWTPLDVVSFNCDDLMVASADASFYMVDISSSPLKNGGTRQYYAGYVVYQQDISNYLGGPANLTDRLIAWVNLLEPSMGFGSGFNGISSEGGGSAGTAITLGGVGIELGEDGDRAPITANTFFPRILIPNNNPETWNWWIFLAGRNEGAITGGLMNSMTRWMTCDYCDEQEICRDSQFRIPYELNVISAADVIPTAVFPAAVFPKYGFAVCTVVEEGVEISNGICLPGAPAAGVPMHVTLTGTIDDPCNNAAYVSSVNGFYSMYAWNYQRADLVNAVGNLDAIPEIHRAYCNLNTGYVGIDTRLGSGLLPYGPGAPLDTNLGLGLFLNYVTGATTATCEAVTP